MRPTPTQSDVISINGATYVKVHDHWMKSPLTSKLLGKQSSEQISR